MYKGLSGRLEDLDRKVTDGFAAVHEWQRQQDKKIEGLEQREQYREGERRGWSSVKVWVAMIGGSSLGGAIVALVTTFLG